MVREVVRSPGTSEYRVIPSKKAFVSRLSERIHHEPTSISLQFYTFEADETGEQIIQALLRKKREHPEVKVQLVADDSNNMFHDNKPIRRGNGAKAKRDHTYQRLYELEQSGIEVSITNYTHFSKINLLHRDHKKLAVFGGDSNVPPTAFVGSANMQNLPWKELVVEMQGAMVPVLQADFDETFRHARTLRRVHTTLGPWDYLKKYGIRYLHEDLLGSVVRNAETKGRRVAYPESNGKQGVVATDSFWPSWFFHFGAQEATNEHLRLATGAKQGDRLDVTTPYPGMLLLSTKLRRAARRGVDVHLSIPANNNHLLYNPDLLLQNATLKRLHIARPVAALGRGINRRWENSFIKSGVHLHRYRGEKEDANGMVHAKVSLLTRLDGTRRGVVGSTNISRGPISGLNRELVVASEDPSFTQQLAAYVADLQEDSLPVFGK